MIAVDMLILIVMVFTACFTYRHGVLTQIRKIDSEIDKMSDLEK